MAGKEQENRPSATLEPSVVSTVIKSSSSEEDTLITSPRKKGRSKKSKRQKSPAASLDRPKEIKKSYSWLTTVSNLVLVAAIFTIIFAVHKSISNKNRTQPIVTPSAASEETIAKKEQSVKNEQPAKNEQTADINKTTDDQKNTEPAEKIAVKNLLQEINKTTPTKKQIDRISDYKNPWNDGGPQDLDGESARQEYRKHYLSANESDN